MFKRVLAPVVGAAMMVASCVSSQQPPTSGEAKRIDAVVNKAAALVERQGYATYYPHEVALFARGKIENI